MEPIKLTGSEWSVLDCLWRENPQTVMQMVANLSKTVGWAKSTTITTLRRMEEKGLVRRSVSGSDARRRLITLTEKGAEQQALFQRSFLDVEEAMVRGFAPEEKETLAALLNRVIQNLKEDSEE